MTAPDPGLGLALAVGAAAASALLAAAALRYARRRALLDVPGQRRLHHVPTPRGGGIAIVAVALGALALATAQGWVGGRDGSAFFLALAAVAGVGFLDDHRPLPVWPRLLVHFAAAAAVAWASAPASSDALPWLVLQTLLLVGAINAWNFMDGSNGMVALQSAWTAACAMTAFGLAGQWGWSLVAAALAAACLGFLPFNFPRARIFLGDVGSGALGLACGTLLLLAYARGALDGWSALLVVVAMGADAGLTLASRVLRGRRWYTAHREHLFQWMVRCGHSHARVAWLYLAWNFLVVLPLLLLARPLPAYAPFFAVAAALAAAFVWWQGKRALLARHRAGLTP